MRQEEVVSTTETPASSAIPPTVAPKDVYAERALHFAALRREWDARSTGNANLNVALFFGALLAVLIGAFGSAPLFFAVGALLFVGFVVAFIRLGRVDRIRRRYMILQQLTEEGPKRLRREWNALPLRQPRPAPSDHPFASDLDLVGHASLQHLLATTSTPAGQNTLQRWLLEPAPVAVALARQQGVKELAPQIEFRDELGVRGRLVGASYASYERFLEWAEDAPWLLQQPGLIWLTRIAPALAILALVFQFTGLTRYPFWLLIIGVNVLLTWTVGREVEKQLDRVSERQSAFQPFADLFDLIERHTFQAPALLHVQSDLARGERHAGTEMTRLARIMRFADVRLSLFFPVVQAALLWNFHVLWYLERWRTANGASARGWLETLSEMEALASLATLTFDNPAWTFPELTEEYGPQAIVTAQQLGHPLLPPEKCVGNDVTIGPPGTFLFVTGSNMSGKSTLLRALGVNIALAQAGGPVCATTLRMPPLSVATSIRVQDSLEEGVSYFMAELRRLKAVVDQAAAVQAAHERTLFFLLDEILHGTNTSERQTAARRVILRLLALGATGAVSTHDLTLAEAAALAARSTAAHFTERFIRGPKGPTMTFDYQLRPGIATSTNALKLMEIVGLPLEDEEYDV